MDEARESPLELVRLHAACVTDRVTPQEAFDEAAAHEYSASSEVLKRGCHAPPVPGKRRTKKQAMPPRPPRPTSRP
eukprot:9441828-Pyramimonas_sp.AAC.1